MATSLEIPRASADMMGQRKLTGADIEALDTYIAEFEAERPAITEFADVRTELDIKNDTADVARIKEGFSKKPPLDRMTTRYGQAMEMVLTEFASSWLPGVYSKSSEYDDLKNKTDLVLEMEDGQDRKLRVAIDVTCNVNEAKEKAFTLINDLRKGVLSQLKYFESQLDHSQDIKTVPRVIVGSDNIDQTSQLMKLYIKYRKSTDATAKNQARKDIEQSPVGREFFGQVVFQLQRARDLLRNATIPRPEREAKMATIDATLAEIEVLQKKNAALSRPSGSTQSRNGVLSTLIKVYQAP